MKFKVLERITIFTLLAIVFYWANYTKIPKGSFVYLIKTLPLILLGIYLIELVFRKLNKRNK